MELLAHAAALRLERCERAPADWEAWLAGASGASFAARAGFLETVERVWPQARVLYFTARRGERLAGAVCVAASVRLGLTWARSLPFGTYGGPLVSPDDPDPPSVRAALARAFEEWLSAERVAGGEVVHAVLSPQQAGDAGPDPAWRALASSITTGQTHVIDLAPGAAAIIAGLHRESRRVLRQAERSGVTIEEDAEALPAVHRLYLRQAKSWSGHRPYPLAFLEAFVRHPSRFARLLVARRAGRVEAGILVLSGGGESFVWWSGAARTSRQSLSYPSLMSRALECACSAGEARLNLGASGGLERLEHFKRSLGAVPRPFWVYHLRPRRDDWVYRVYAWLRAARRRP
jgi:hypothetical protein